VIPPPQTSEVIPPPQTNTPPEDTTPPPPPPVSNITIGTCDYGYFFGQIPSQFNVFVFEDFVCHSSDTEGRLAAGGDVNIANYAVGCKLNNPTLETGSCQSWGAVTCGDLADMGEIVSTVVAGGNVTAVNAEIKVGNVVYGENFFHDQTVRYGAGCAGYPVDNYVDFGYWKEYLQLLSHRLCDLPSTGSYSLEQDGTLRLSGTNRDYLEIFNIPGDKLCSSGTTKVVFTNTIDTATVIVNVIGATLSCGGYQIDGVVNSRTVWNFCSTSSLSFHDVAWFGSVLAPFADITNPSGVVFGQVFANSWIASGDTCMQQNWVPFEGCIDSCLWQSASSFCTFSQTDFAGNECNFEKRVLDSCFPSLTLRRRFDSCFPIGVRVGSEENSLALTNFDAVSNFLPQTGNAGVLDESYIDVTTTPGGAFAGELTALVISIGLDSCTEGFSSACYSFQDMVLCANGDAPCSAFSGMSVGSVVETANNILGGANSEISVESAFNCVKYINNKFQGCSSYLANRHEFSFCSCGTQVCDAKPASVFSLEQDNTPNPQGSTAVGIVPAFTLLFSLITYLCY